MADSVSFLPLPKHWPMIFESQQKFRTTFDSFEKRTVASLGRSNEYSQEACMYAVFEVLVT